jgi:hypothetical protein
MPNERTLHETLQCLISLGSKDIAMVKISRNRSKFKARVTISKVLVIKEIYFHFTYQNHVPLPLYSYRF